MANSTVALDDAPSDTPDPLIIGNIPHRRDLFNIPN
jgi:hypothetical protein